MGIGTVPVIGRVLEHSGLPTISNYSSCQETRLSLVNSRCDAVLFDHRDYPGLVFPSCSRAFNVIICGHIFLSIVLSLPKALSQGVLCCSNEDNSLPKLLTRLSSLIKPRPSGHGQLGMSQAGGGGSMGMLMPPPQAISPQPQGHAGLMNMPPHNAMGSVQTPTESGTALHSLAVLLHWMAASLAPSPPASLEDPHLSGCNLAHVHL